MVFIFRGACDFATKAKHAVAAGAVALVVINHDQSRPDYAFSMVNTSRKGENEVAPAAELSEGGGDAQNSGKLQIPCVMVSWNSGHAMIEDQPERLRLYPGGGRPFIESVSDDAPVVFLIHNLLEEDEREYLKNIARPMLRPSVESDDEVMVKQKPAERSFQRAVLHHGMWKSSTMKAIDEKLFSIINFPPEYFADLQVRSFAAPKAELHNRNRSWYCSLTRTITSSPDCFCSSEGELLRNRWSILASL
jgi:hypothetical protein